MRILIESDEMARSEKAAYLIIRALESYQPSLSIRAVDVFTGEQITPAFTGGGINEPVEIEVVELP